MDLVSTCKDKLAHFRIKELKEVLTQLGLAKQGKKQDLVDRILAVLSDEQAPILHGWAKRNSIGKEAIAKIIDDTYRKMQNPGARDLATTAHSGSDVNNVKPKNDHVDSYRNEMKVRCPCGNTLPTESMIQCEDPRCRVWQHINCVIIPEKPTDGVPAVPSQFFCEICRVARADPFWISVAHPLLPVKLTTSNIPTDGTNPVQSIEKTFQLNRADRDLLHKNGYDVQAWCILLNDKVPFRMHWPQYADLQVNGVPFRTTNRPGSQLLGANGRDDGPTITCTREGINKIFLSGCDARIFCLGVRIAMRRTVQQILSLIPKEGEGEPFEDALARVCRCVGGGNATDNADSDSDLEVVADSISVNLRCPMSGSRIKTAGRFKPCAHMGCFDLDTFVELNQRSRKWQCPICLKNYSLENVIIDPYFNRITTMMRGCEEDVTDIEVKPNGSWRAKNEKERLNLAQWHYPDGSLCVISERDVESNLETSKRVKQEGGSEGHSGLKIGIKKNRMGIWQVSKPDNLQSLSSESQLEDKFANQFEKIVPMSSSATESCRDGEDPSVNQDGAGLFDLSANNGNELDSFSRNFDPAYRAGNRIPSAPNINEDVIVLSDSDDENGNLVSPDVYGTAQSDAVDLQFPLNPSGVPVLYPEHPGVNTSGASSLFPPDGDLWCPAATQGDTGFQLFSEANGSATLAETQNTSLSDYPIVPNTTESAHAVSYPVCPSSNGVNGGLTDDPPAFDNEDPSLHIFLPSRPVGVSVQADSREQPDMSNGLRTEDWISLRLGGGSSCTGETSSTNNWNSRQDNASKDGRMQSLADTASLLLSMNDGGSEKATPNNKRLGGTFSHPRQPRSVRPRLYLSIDSDTD